MIMVCPPPGPPAEAVSWSWAVLGAICPKLLTSKVRYREARGGSW